jgi:hypothetical protein
MGHSVFLLDVTETAALEIGTPVWRTDQTPESRLFPQARQGLQLQEESEYA